MTDNIALSEPIHRYIIEHSLRPNAVLKELVTVTRQLPRGKMSTQLDEINFIAFLLKLIAAHRVIEIGVFTGCATLGMALALPDDGKIIACEIDDQWANMSHDYWQRANVADKISLHIAPAEETLDNLLANNQQEQFDAIFIDAHKKSYLNYYQKSIQLIRRGGLIIIDNMLWQGKVADESIQDNRTNALRQMLETMHSDQRIDLSLVPVGDGMALARKR